MRRLSMILIIALLLIGLALVISGGLAASASTTESGANAVALAPTATSGVSAEATPISSNINLSGLSSPRILAWNPNTTQLAWYAASGQPVAVAKASSAKVIVIPCGMPPSADRMIVYVGGDTSQPLLFALDGGSAVSLGTNIGLACAVPGRTQFSPDGNHLGILKYANNVVEANYTAGTLRILKLPDGTEEHAMDSVTAFDTQNDGTLTLELFANTKKEANSADIVFWDGSKERKVDENIKADDNCQFAAADIRRGGDKVYTLFGEKCKPGGSKWRLVRTDFAGGNTADVAKGPTGSNGSALYFNSAGGNNLWLLPGGKEALISVPNGLSNDLVNLARVSLADGTLTNVISNVVVPTYPPSAPNRFLFSPKGDHLAFVQRDRTGGEKLFMYDLNATQNPPSAVAGGNASDRINGLAWTADSNSLFYVITGEDNAMIYTTVKGDTKRVVRGSFQGLAIKPDGSAASTSEQVQAGTNDLRNNLVLVNVSDQSKVNLVEGAKKESALVPITVR